MSKIDPNKLLISSDFYTVQGEGISSGIPAYFVRLGICNLTCGMSRAFTNKLMKEQSLEDGEIFEGDLVKEGKAAHGYNARTNEYGDMIEMGIIDPTKVTRTAIENAVSIASMILMTECVIVDEPSKDEEPQMPMM